MNPFEFPDNILRYSEAHSSEVDDILNELYRTTHLRTVHPQMLSGKVQGNFLRMISKLAKPSRILEIGTFTGYASYCLAQGLSENGQLITIEVNDELEDLILEFFDKSGIADKTELIIGDAQEVIPALEGEFDLVFLDANKEHYPDYYHLIKDRIKAGGILITDNVLWGGKVAEVPLPDESSRKIDEFNKLIQADETFENVFLTLRDGLLLAQKKYFV